MSIKNQDTNNKNTTNENIFNTSLKQAFRGGISGSIAMIINICTLMPMRTTVNYQYRYGTSSIESFKILYRDGGFFRFYKGFGFAIIQGPWSRFGDTFANSGTIALLNSLDSTRDMNIGTKTLLASSAASLFRIISTPLDTCKTTLQVEGKSGLKKVQTKFRNAGGIPRGLPVLWYGAMGSASATFIGHYPWFFTYNYLQEKIPEQKTLIGNLSKNAFIGFSASAVSDTCSNSLRVLKTYRQTHPQKISYTSSIKEIISKDGVGSLFGRGLKTKIVSNGIQGSLFAVLWKYIEKNLKQ